MDSLAGFLDAMAPIPRGLFRYFYTHRDGAESTKGFFPEGNIIVSYSALVEGRASHFSIQALEDSEIDLVDYAALQDRFQPAPWFKDASLAMVRKGFCTKEERERQLLLFSAVERYRAFLAAYPGLDRRVKLHLIASYLGIKPESLSRIRRRIGALT